MIPENLKDFEDKMIRVIKEGKATQAQVAGMYCQKMILFGIGSDNKRLQEVIKKRWSDYGLDKILGMAWSYLEGVHIMMLDQM